ncbi:MAG: 3-oxoacid CoA-transferase subunit A [Gammaproteobacteria bacterium]|nr:MAG: 3-oxoacid CoA-transferase subunit A [Gammaproteobacteria bacterium]
MIDKIAPSLAEAVRDIADGSVVLIGGFIDQGTPDRLLEALAERKPRNLTVVANNPSVNKRGMEMLLRAGCIGKLVCSFPRSPSSDYIEQLIGEGKLELEVVPQGTLAERVRSAGAGIPGFYTRTAVGTPLAEGKEHREFNGETYIFENAIRGDFALINAERADRWGNLTYAGSLRNFNPVMAMGARVTIAQVREIVPAGAIDPAAVVTPGIFVKRVVKLED